MDRRRMTRYLPYVAAACAMVGLLIGGPAQARTIVLSCVYPGHPEMLSTYYVDLDARTVTTTANSIHHETRTYPAEITDRTIRYWSGNIVLGTIDRYSGILSNELNSFDCHVVEGQKIR